MENQIIPVIDPVVLQEKASEFAMKGAIETIRDFYSGYDSPYKKLVKEELEKTKIGTSITLPDIIALINEQLSNEINLIANNAIAQTFIPMVQRFLVREEKEIKFSDILKEFIKVYNCKSDDDCDVSVNEHPEHGWLDIELSESNQTHSFTLHKNREKKGEKCTYCILSLPRDSYESGRYPLTMKLSSGDITLEMPFAKDVLRNDFTAYIARLIVGNCVITMDCSDFYEDMFEDQCHC